MLLELSDQWNGESVVDGRTYLNHDSLHTGEDVLALVRTISKFDGFHGAAEAGFQIVEPRSLKGALLRLGRAARGDETMITVAKGIHQRQTDPHIRITLGTEADTFHVVLQEKYLDARKRSFSWEVVAVSVVKPVAKEIAIWPANYSRSLSRGGQHSLRMRRNSIVNL